ncbi:MAG: nucleotide exchange factor GrpE [Bacteroidales bacterium]|jgi:molecular chaperone GrpE|nr:nucleotide exchange factor GrpE [Bacteroidales bacterium]
MAKEQSNGQEDEIPKEELTDTELALGNDDDASGQTPETEILQGKLAETQDKYLRLSAEFDNFRKRTLREKMDLIQTAGESLIKDMLPVVDDFERGLEVIEKADDIASIKTGMSLIYNKLQDFLSAHGIQEVKAMQEPFDADRHEAVTNIPAPSEELKGKVVDVIQKGYVLHEKIIRYPKVVVGE